MVTLMERWIWPTFGQNLRGFRIERPLCFECIFIFVEAFTVNITIIMVSSRIPYVVKCVAAWGGVAAALPRGEGRGSNVAAAQRFIVIKDASDIKLQRGSMGTIAALGVMLLLRSSLCCSACANCDQCCTRGNAAASLIVDKDTAQVT